MDNIINNTNEARGAGRPRVETAPETFEEQVRAFRAGEITADAAAKACGISRMTFFRRLNEGKEKKAAPSLGEILKAGPVSGSNTGLEQIVYIGLDQIDPDPCNFYSLEGLEDLAENLELIGLQQPLRVRPEDGRYIIVSGHRRRAACMMIRDGGSPQFDGGVPCIVEYGEATPAMRELRLIYANSSTRVMSSAEISKQAERVTQLLYELKEQGVEFPGRMREHVAQACQVSSSKLARLHAIRANLDPELLPYYDRGELNEEAAYHLSRFPQELQAAVARELTEGRRKTPPVASVVKEVLDHLEELQKPLSCRAHAGGPHCHHVERRIVYSVFDRFSWHICKGDTCCMDCFKAKEGCSGACAEAKARVKLEKDVAAEKQKERETAADAERRATRARVARRCRELLPLIDAAGLKDEERIYPGYEAAKVKEIRQWAETGGAGKEFYSDACVKPWKVEDLKAMAVKLEVPTWTLLGEEAPEAEPKEEPEAPAVSGPDTVPEPRWLEGTPEKAGRFLCLVDMGGTVHENRCEWNGDGWLVYDNPLAPGWTVVGWWPLPERRT